MFTPLLIFWSHAWIIEVSHGQSGFHIWQACKLTKPTNAFGLEFLVSISVLEFGYLLKICEFSSQAITAQPLKRYTQQETSLFCVKLIAKSQKLIVCLCSMERTSRTPAGWLTIMLNSKRDLKEWNELTFFFFPTSTKSEHLCYLMIRLSLLIVNDTLVVR